MEYDKKFLILGNMNAINCKEIFPLIKDNKIWAGCKCFGGGMNMIQPEETFDESKTKSFTVNDKGEIIKNIMGVIWFTNLDHTKRHEPLDLYKRYTPEEFPKYDNYDAINVDKVCDIPEDYKGIMGVPITFLDKYCPEQFEILGCTQRGCHDLVPDTKKYDDFIEMKPDGTPTGSKGGKTNENANLKGNDGKKNYFINKDGYMVQSLYGRIFIKSK